MLHPIRVFLAFVVLLLSFQQGKAFNNPPANDTVAAAFDIGLLPAPGLCPANPVGDTVMITGTTSSATFNSADYSSLSCFPGSPSPDVWYRFRATGAYVYIEIAGSSGLNNFFARLYYSQNSVLSLVPLDCSVSSAGVITAILPTPVLHGEYYLQIGGSNSTESGDFSMLLKAENYCSGCVKTGEVTLSPAPFMGRYNLGDTVTMCTTVDRWETITSSYLHGIVPQFGPGWDLSSLTPLQAPATQASTGGSWQWFTGITTPNGTESGFFFDANGNNNPSDNPGDNGAVLSSWTGCWKIRTGTQCTTDDIGVNINLYSDAQTGNGSSFAVCDPFEGFHIGTSLSCCTALSASITAPANCTGSSSAVVSPDANNMTSTFNYYLYNQNMTLIAVWNSHVGPITILGLNPGEYLVEGDNLNTSCESYLTLTVPQLMTTHVAQVQTGCGSGTGSAIATIDSGGLAPFTYYWPNVPTSNYVDSAAYNLPDGWVSVLITDASGCTVSDSVFITSQSMPDAIFEFGDTAYCSSIDTVHVQYPAATMGGTYSLISPQSVGITVNASTGDVIIANSTQTPPYWVYVKYSLSSICSAAYIDSFRVTSAPAAPSIVGNATLQYCIGSSPTVLNVTVPPIDFVLWYDLQTSQSGLGNSYTTPMSASTLPGTYFYTAVAVLGTNSACYSSPVFFSVNASYPPYFNISADTTICIGDMASIAITPCSTCVYSWTPAPVGGSASAYSTFTSPQATTTYTMTATDPLGCASSLFTTVNVAICDSLPNQALHIYSGITPNNDGHNDLWIIDGVDQLNGVVVSIYNRWGQLVWQKSGYDNVNVVWNGHDQQGDPLPDGTYYYVLRSTTVQLANWVEVSH